MKQNQKQIRKETSKRLRKKAVSKIKNVYVKRGNDQSLTSSENLVLSKHFQSTIKRKIKKAFSALREAGYFAEMDFTCCQSCGVGSLPDDCNKYVFYHDQDNDMLMETGSCYICWGGDGVEIKKILEENALIVVWNGKDSRRMEITVPLN